MKEQAINMINNLKGFLDNIKSISQHPYGNGVNVNKLVDDLQAYTNDLKSTVEKIEEVPIDAEEQEEGEENSH